MKTALIVGDSIGMPRLDTSYNTTWPFLLCDSFKEDIHFVYCLKRAMTSADLNADTLENFNPDIVVLHVGIVDCAPRLFGENAILPKLLRRLPKRLQNRAWNFIKEKKTRKRSNTIVSVNDFKSNISDYLQRAHNIGTKVLVLGIQNVSEPMISRNRYIRDNIEKYNAIISVVCKKNNQAFIKPVKNITGKDLIEDGYHLNSNGNRKVADALIPVFREAVSNTYG